MAAGACGWWQRGWKSLSEPMNVGGLVLSDNQTELSPIDKAMRRVRWAVNKPSTQEQLIHKGDEWHHFCAAMDLVEDTDKAVQAYCQMPEDVDGGHLYLATYGVLQALFVQSDAYRRMRRILGFDPELSTELKEIRDLRNCAVGHPADRGGKPYGIMAISLTNTGFTLYSFDDLYAEKSKQEFREIKLHGEIRVQERIIKDGLVEMEEALSAGSFS